MNVSVQIFNVNEFPGDADSAGGETMLRTAALDHSVQRGEAMKELYYSRKK